MENSENVVARPNVDDWLPGEMSAKLSVLLLLVGAALMGYGLYQTFTYDDTSRLVGGDAFNLQILAARGLVFVCTGVGFCVAAIAHAVLSLRAYLLARFPIGG